MGTHAEIGGLELTHGDRRLVWELGETHVSVGWPLIGGGRSAVTRVEWHFATADDLTPEVDALNWLSERLERPGETAAFLTSRRLDAVDAVSVPSEYGPVQAIATVGLGNALRVGDPVPGAPARVGTINLAVRLPVALTEGALLEALSIGQEAKCAAVLESGVCSIVTQKSATGTGTDCALVLAPPGGEDAPIQYAGKHTELGSAIGRAAFDAITRGVERWKVERGVSFPSCPDEAPVAPTSWPTRGGAARVVLVGGGVRSGKSRFAEHRALMLAAARDGCQPVYIATSEVLCDEMAERVERHRKDRGDAFETLEVPQELEETLLRLGERPEGAPSVCLVECLTLWISNLICAGFDDAAIELRLERLVEVAQAADFPVVFVSNEVGLGIVPESAMGRRFRDHSGRLHQALGRTAKEVYFAALGLIQRLKPGPTMTMPPC